jgi:hypothetical protein
MILDFLDSDNGQKWMIKFVHFLMLIRKLELDLVEIIKLLWFNSLKPLKLLLRNFMMLIEQFKAKPK